MGKQGVWRQRNKLYYALSYTGKFTKPRHGSTDREMDKDVVIHIYNRISLSHLKKNEIMPFVATGVDLETVILSELSETEKEKYCMTILICGI